MADKSVIVRGVSRAFEFRCKQHLAKTLRWNQGRELYECGERGCDSHVTAEENYRLGVSSDESVFVDRLDRRGVAVYRLRGVMAPTKVTPRSDTAHGREIRERVEPSAATPERSVEIPVLPDADEPSSPRRGCPDGGACHHECAERHGGCWRVWNAGPLSGVFVNDVWPSDVRDVEAKKVAAHGRSVLDDLPSYEEVTAEMDALIDRLAALMNLRSAIFRNDVERVRRLAEPLRRAKQEEARRVLAERITGG